MAFSDAQFGFGEKLLLPLAVTVILFRFFPFYHALAIFAVMIISIYGYLRHLFGFFKRQGIPGPPVDSYIMGNLPTLRKKGVHGIENEWVRKYGPIYGTFLMQYPEYVISDMHLLKRILVKDFAHFPNRRAFTRSNTNTLLSKILTKLNDQRWKDVRSTITPAFTSSKIKQMIPLIEKCVLETCDVLDKKSNDSNEIDSKELLGNLTMDVTASVAFGFETDCQQSGTNHLMIKNCKAVLDSRIVWKILLIFSFNETVYWIGKFLGLQFLFKKEEDYFRATLTPAIKERKQNPQNNRADFLQLLIKSLQTEGDEVEVDSLISSPHLGGKHVQLSTDDIIAQSFLFLLAGYETTASTINFLFYQLANDQKMQDRCLEEIKEVLSDDKALSYDSLMHLPFIEAVMMETLRMYPPAPRIDRCCSIGVDLDGIHIPEGAGLVIPVYAIHHSEQFYPNPETFDPERFLGEEKTNRDPLTYLPFGYGPRNCIGMRLAQMEIKITLARILPKFRVFATDKTEPQPLKLHPEGLLKPLNTIILGFEKREPL